MEEQMEAMVLSAHGGPEVLSRATVRRVPPGPREVEVRVRAVAMNHMDLWVRRGLPHLKLPYPFRLGCDITGEISALGPGAPGAVGDRVMLQPGVSCGTCGACLEGRDNLCKRYGILGETRQGGYGQYVVVPDANVLPLPASLSFEDGAALPLCLQTAWQMVFDKGQVKPGQTVLAHAAGSGVTSLAIQLAKLVGARVLCTTGSAEKADKARALGADEVIRYDAGHDWVSEVKRLTGKLGPDVILDHVGGEVFEKSVLAVRWGGRIVTVGATSGFAATIDLRQIFFRQVEILGSTMGSKSTLWKALPLVAAGKIRPVVDRVVPLWDAREAHAALEARRAFGKIVLSVPG